MSGIKATPHVCYISMLCEQGSEEHSVCSLHSEGPDDGRWFGRALGAAAQLSIVSISNGARLPDVGQFDAIVLGGTFHGVHDGRPWQLRLRAWLQAHRNTGKPLLGICGGHQAMAVVAGGTVTRRPSGPQVGTISLDVSSDGVRHPLLGVCPGCMILLDLSAPAVAYMYAEHSS